MTPENRLKHLLVKYPDLTIPLSSNTIKKSLKCSQNRLDKILRHSLERNSRYRSKKPSRKLLKLLVSQALTCSICSRILSNPVTLECGDTFCRRCLTENIHKECPDCGMAMLITPRCNILVQEVLDRFTPDLEEDLQFEFDQVSRTYKLRNQDLDLNNCENESPLATGKSKQLPAENVANEQLMKTKEGLSSNSLECILCTRCLYEPVTTWCGHTFCRGCIARVLDYGLSCPLCMASLTNFDPAICRVVNQLLQCLAPKEHEQRCLAWKREVQMVDEEDLIPVFICISAFPTVACPLYVYEPRYRLLTRRCLQSNRRRFAMAAPSSGLSDQERFAPYGTVLEVRDAVYFQDGTSILTTVGVRRFKVIARGEKDGYDTATIEYIHDTPPSPTLHLLHDRVYQKAQDWFHSLPQSVQAEVEQSLGIMPPLESCWANLPDGPSWAWWLMPVLPLSAHLQLGFLSTTNLEKRLRAIDKLLDRMTVRMSAQLGRVKTNQEKQDGASCGFVEERLQATNSMEF